VTCADKAHLNEFVKANQRPPWPRDVDGNYAYLADTGVNLRLAQGALAEGAVFTATREHASS